VCSIFNLAQIAETANKILHLNLLRRQTSWFIGILAKHNPHLHIAAGDFLEEMLHEDLILWQIAFGNFFPFHLAEKVQLLLDRVQPLGYALVLRCPDQQAAVEVRIIFAFFFRLRP